MLRSAIIMSIYSKDKPEYLKVCLDSIMCQIDYIHYSLYIAIDGIINDELNLVLKQYDKLPNVYLFYFNQNLGLAKRLNFLIDRVLEDVKIGYIFRMDADDICMPDRFFKQIKFLEANTKIDVLGSSVIEINDIGEKISLKLMEEQDSTLKKDIVKRCPFNHPTVVFKRRIFQDGFRYNEKLKNTQDYYFWITLAQNNYAFSNIKEPLLFFRISKNFYHRRGLEKAFNDFYAKIFAIKALKRHNPINYLFALLIFLLRISPTFLQKIAYRKLRKGVVFG